MLQLLLVVAVVVFFHLYAPILLSCAQCLKIAPQLLTYLWPVWISLSKALDSPLQTSLWFLDFVFTVLRKIGLYALQYYF